MSTGRSLRIAFHRAPSHFQVVVIAVVPRPGQLSTEARIGRPSTSAPIMAWFGLGVDEAGRGGPLSTFAVAVGEIDVSGAVGDALGLLGITPNGLLKSDEALGVGEEVAKGCSATRGGCRDDHSAKAVTDPATRAIAAPTTITRSRCEGILTPTGTRIGSDGYGPRSPDGPKEDGSSGYLLTRGRPYRPPERSSWRHAR